MAEHWLPRWLAPNLITLTGMAALMVAYTLTASYLPNFEHPGPRWLYLVSAAAVFFYLHMDALDGKQARRTGTSSPLGQLFDHGCDALAVHLILVNMITSLQLGHEWRTIVSMVYVCIPWWMAHWEEYHTGVMSYGNGLWGVTEANYAVVALHLYTFALGPYAWLGRPFSWVAARLPSAVIAAVPAPALALVTSLRGNDLFLINFFFMGVALFWEQVTRVTKAAASPELKTVLMSKAEQGHKTLGPGAAAWHLAQILGTHAMGAALMSLPTAVPGHARVLMATFGVTYALQATRLIMAHMAKEPFRVAAWPLALMAVQMANQRVFGDPPLDPVLLAYAVNAVVVAGYLHYVVGMTGEICEFLGIKALTIKPARE